MQLRDCRLSDNASKNKGFAQRAVARRSERKQETLVKRSRLVRGFLEGEVQVKVHAAVQVHIVAALWQENKVEEALRLGGVEIRRKDASGCVGRVRRPRLGVREEEDVLPLCERGDDLEDLGQGAGLVVREEAADLGGEDAREGSRHAIQALALRLRAPCEGARLPPPYSLQCTPR